MLKLNSFVEAIGSYTRPRHGQVIWSGQTCDGREVRLIAVDVSEGPTRGYDYGMRISIDDLPGVNPWDSDYDSPIPPRIPARSVTIFFADELNSIRMAGCYGQRFRRSDVDAAIEVAEAFSDSL